MSAFCPSEPGLGQDAELRGGVVEIEERPDAPQPRPGLVELAVQDGVHDELAPGRREALELAGVRADSCTGAATKRPSVSRGPVPSTRASGAAVRSRPACSASAPGPCSGPLNVSGSS